MKRKKSTQRILFGILLILLSVFVYVLHFVFFRDMHHILIYLVGDIAFVFIEVLLVTVIIHQLLREREKRALMSKLNMVIGAFFSEAGTSLLEFFASFDNNPKQISEMLRVDNEWTAAQFQQIRQTIKTRGYNIDIKAGDIKSLQEFIIDKRKIAMKVVFRSIQWHLQMVEIIFKHLINLFCTSEIE